MKTIEILAPAGSYESMVGAFNAGADAVYMGGQQFGARAYADNPDENGLLSAIDYAHIHGKKLYLTVNTLQKDGELETQLYNYLYPLYIQGLDAVIVQDMGVLQAIRGWFSRNGGSCQYADDGGRCEPCPPFKGAGRDPDRTGQRTETG